MFDSLSFDTKPNQEFLKFISVQEDKKKFKNLDMILELENEYPDILVKVMSDFESLKAYRHSLDETGRPIRVPWEEALKRFYLDNKYVGVTSENIDIANLFGGKGLLQGVFDKATELRKQAQDKNIPEHVLGKELKEETILESIERIRNQTEKQLIDGKQMIEDLYEKQFTYEWLSKNDPHNSIMGLFCSCCGTITSAFYGRQIAISSILAQNIQNLVVRNSKGEIISKGTMYVNKDKGYAVINDFELNQKYRAHETSSGKYDEEKDKTQAKERKLIFKAFMRGLHAFIEEYDKQNPDTPLQQVNIGMGYNRLKKQVEKFKKATSLLKVPEQYSFEDAGEEQYVLYSRDKRVVEEKGFEREL